MGLRGPAIGVVRDSVLQAVGLPETACYGGRVLLLVASTAAFIWRIAASEILPPRASRASRRPECWRKAAARDGDGLVGREVVAVVFENDHAQGRDEAVGGIAGDDVNLFLFQCAVEQARGP